MATLLNRIKPKIAISPALVDNAAFTANVLDKQDFDNAKGVLFLVATGTMDAALTALKVEHSDTKTNDTTLGGTPTELIDVTAKPSATDDDEIVEVYVPMSQWTERYLQLQATAADGTNGVNLCVLALADLEGDLAPTAASHGVEAIEIA